MKLRLKTADQFFRNNELHWLFVANAIPSNYSETVFDKVQNGEVEVKDGEGPLRCEVFIRRIAGDDRQVLATLRFDKTELGTPLSSDLLSGMTVLL